VLSRVDWQIMRCSSRKASCKSNTLQVRPMKALPAGRPDELFDQSIPAQLSRSSQALGPALRLPQNFSLPQIPNCVPHMKEVHTFTTKWLIESKHGFSKCTNSSQQCLDLELLQSRWQKVYIIYLCCKPVVHIQFSGTLSKLLDCA